jgi:bifunctional non-homologous end joining protein LigD
MPIHWGSVKAGLDPAVFTLHTAPAQLGKIKPWRDYDKSARSLADAIRVLTSPHPAKRPRKLKPAEK